MAKRRDPYSSGARQLARGFARVVTKLLAIAEAEDTPLPQRLDALKHLSSMAIKDRHAMLQMDIEARLKALEEKLAGGPKP